MTTELILKPAYTDIRVPALAIFAMASGAPINGTAAHAVYILRHVRPHSQVA
jgi:hypothetical protein